MCIKIVLKTKTFKKNRKKLRKRNKLFFDNF